MEIDDPSQKLSQCKQSTFSPSLTGVKGKHLDYVLAL